MAGPALREPVEETFAWLRGRIASVLAEGVRRGGVDNRMDLEATAAAIVATVQAGYVLARAARSTEPFDQAITGIPAVLDAPERL